MKDEMLQLIAISPRTSPVAGLILVNSSTDGGPTTPRPFEKPTRNIGEVQIIQPNTSASTLYSKPQLLASGADVGCQLWPVE